MQLQQDHHPDSRSVRRRNAPVRTGSAAPLRTRAARMITVVVRVGSFVVPTPLLYRSVLDARERRALALLSSTQLPRVVAITALATTSGHMASLDGGSSGGSRAPLGARLSDAWPAHREAVDVHGSSSLGSTRSTRSRSALGVRFTGLSKSRRGDSNPGPLHCKCLICMAFAIDT